MTGLLPLGDVSGSKDVRRRSGLFDAPFPVLSVGLAIFSADSIEAGDLTVSNDRG